MNLETRDRIPSSPRTKMTQTALGHFCLLIAERGFESRRAMCERNEHRRGQARALSEPAYTDRQAQSNEVRQARLSDVWPNPFLSAIKIALKQGLFFC